MSKGCLRCGGDGTLVNGEPCPECGGKEEHIPILEDVPIQYQGLKFDKDLLPQGMSDYYGKFMEDLKDEIIRNASTFQRNTLICCRPNCGKSVWAYNVYSLLKNAGISIPPIRDILEVRNILGYATDDIELAKGYTNDRFAIIKIPRHVTAEMFDAIQFIVERRVNHNGCTIFLYGGIKEDLKKQDYFKKLKYIAGTGAFNSVKIESFYDKTNKESYYGD